MDRQIDRLRRETEHNRTLRAGLYESVVTGILTKMECYAMKREYSDKIKAATERVQQLQVRQKELEKQVNDYTCLADRLAAVDKDTTLSALLVRQLIERVIVNSPVDVEIQFRFEGDFDQLMEELSDG